MIMRRIFKIFTTPTARSTAFFYFGNFAVSIGRYLFHVLLMRLLLPSEYGEFLAYLSLLYILGIPNATISSVVVKFVSDFRGKEDRHSIKALFYHLIKQLTPVSLSLGLVLILLSGTLSSALKALPVAFVILGISIFISLISTVVRSYLLAFQHLIAQIIIGLVEVLTTLFLASIFIFMGLSATGAVLAQILAGIVSLLISLWVIRGDIYPYVSKAKLNFSLGSFTGYSLIYALGSTSLISTDVLMVRYFLTEHLSGIYSSLAVIGRATYFGLGPLISLILPIASHRHSWSGSSKSVFYKLGAVILFIGLLSTAIFVIFPELVISLISSGGNYLQAAGYLPVFALAILIFSLNLFLINYFMAIGKPEINLYLLIITILQPIVIFFFHENISQIVWTNLLIECSLFIVLIYSLIRELYYSL